MPRIGFFISRAALVAMGVGILGSGRPAGASEPTPASVLEVMRRAADYQLDLQARDLATSKSDINLEWVRGAFFTGVMALVEATSDTKYIDAASTWGARKNWELDIPDTRHADWQCIGQVYLELYLMKRDPAMLAGIKRNVDAQVAAPRPGRVEWWWCDALYMAPPMLTRLYAATGDRKYLDFLNTMYWDTWEFLYDRDENLFYRDKNYFGKTTKHGEKVFWSRGNGWVLAGLARLIPYLRADDPSRPRFVELFQQMARRIAEIQPEDGLWRPSLLDPKDFATSETSGSSFFTFALAWGVNNGLLDRGKYMPVVLKAWEGLAAAVTPEGRLGYVQKVAAAPGPVNPADTREYAVGALLLAGNEVLKMLASNDAPTTAAAGQAGSVHPRVFMDPAGLDRLRTRARTLPWARKYAAKMVKGADAFLARAPDVPTIGGQWAQHYVCKECGGKLTHEAGRHHCAKCGKEYAGWPYNEVVAGRVHRANWSAVQTLGLAYALTGEEKYARGARDLLLAYADVYPSFPIHDYQGGTMRRGGRMLAQTLDESVASIPLVLGYDLVHGSPSLSDADRDRIDNRMMRNVARTIARNDMGVSNWQSWHNAALYAIGRVLGDDRLTSRAIHGRSGFLFQMEHSVLPDGFWYEGAPAYHFYALEALRWNAAAARAAGDDAWRDPHYLAMYEAPLDYVFPGGMFPAVNDSNALNIASQAGAYDAAFGCFGDARFAAVAAQRPRAGEEPFLFGADDLGAASGAGLPVPETSRDFTGIGAVMLRQGAGTKQTCVHLDYGPHGGAHGHADKLGVIVYLRGGEVAPDSGNTSYASPFHRKWYRQTLAHNTLVVDGRSQDPTSGALTAFGQTPACAYARAGCDTAYPGVRMARTVIVRPDYVLDVFDAQSSATHTYDLAWHLTGVAKPSFETNPADAPGTTDGYQMVKKVRAADIADSWSVSFAGEKRRTTRLSMAGGEPTRVFVAEGMMGQTPAPCPVVIARRDAASARFVSLLAPGSGYSLIDAVPDGDAGLSAVRLQVRTPKGVDTFEVANAPEGQQPLLKYTAND